MEVHKELRGADLSLAEEAHMRAHNNDSAHTDQLALLTEAVLVVAARLEALLYTMDRLQADRSAP